VGLWTCSESVGFDLIVRGYDARGDEVEAARQDDGATWDTGYGAWRRAYIPLGGHDSGEMLALQEASVLLQELPAETAHIQISFAAITELQGKRRLIQHVVDPQCTPRHHRLVVTIRQFVDVLADLEMTAGVVGARGTECFAVP